MEIHRLHIVILFLTKIIMYTATATTHITIKPRQGHFIHIINMQKLLKCLQCTSMIISMQYY